MVTDAAGDWPEMGRSLREARKAKRLRQSDVAPLVGVDASQVSRIEKTGNLNIVMLRRFARAIGIPAPQLVEYAERLTGNCITFQGTPVPPWERT